MAEVIARVIAEDGKPEGGLVELSNGETTLNGRVAAVSENEFLVNWEDGARTVENQSDYELVVTAAPKASPKVPEGFIIDEPIDLGENVTELEVPLIGKAATKTAQENPAQPAGWAVPPMDANAHPGGELFMLEQEKRAETAQWEDAQNRPPVDAENPAQPAGFAVPPASGGPIPGQGADGLIMAARVYADDVTGEGGYVELTNGNIRVAGKILASDEDSFIVEWEDDRRTVESKADYDLVMEAGIGDAIRDMRDNRLRKKDEKFVQKRQDVDVKMRSRGVACTNCGIDLNGAVESDGVTRRTMCPGCSASPKDEKARATDIGAMTPARRRLDAPEAVTAANDYEANSDDSEEVVTE